jgi:hypothetical protein
MTAGFDIGNKAGSALYVDLELDTWEAKPPVKPDQDEVCERCGYRRLDPTYYAWLRSRMTAAKKANRTGRLADAYYEQLRARFNAVHFWAVERFGEQALLEAMKSLDPTRYSPPTVKEPEEPSPLLPHVYPTDGDWRFTEPVSAETVAKVDAIRDQALALGWSEVQLYQNRGRYSFPCGQDYGLVCFLHGDDQVGEITHQSIEIINARGSRLRFHNHNVDQPWLRHVGISEITANRPDTLATAPVCNY